MNLDAFRKLPPSNLNACWRHGGAIDEGKQSVVKAFDYSEGAVKPSAPTVTSAVWASSTTGRTLPSRSSTTDASEYQEGMTALPQKSRRRGSRTDQRRTG